MQSKRWWGRAVALFIAAGLLVSLYLYVRGNKLSETGAMDAAGSDVCSTVFQTSCDGTLQSEYSNLLGLSLGGWGMVYFATLGALLIAGSMLRTAFMPAALSVALAVNLVGLAVSGYLAWLFVSKSVPLCPLCVVTHIVNLGLFIALVFYRRGAPAGFLKDVATGLAWVFAPNHRSTPEHTLRAVTFTAIALFAVATWLGLALNSRPAQATPAPILTASAPAAAPQTAAERTVEQVYRNIIQAYLDQDPVDIPVGASDPRIGPADAPAQLVFFSDFECPSCKANAKIVERIAQIYRGRISIVAKNYPLSSTCNTAITANPHKFACGAANASVAAHMQGKYWPFHELVYSLKGAPTPQALLECARAAGLDLARFQADMDSDLAKTKVAEDIDLAIKLKVIQTPTMYLNGRLLTPATTPHIAILLEQIFATAGAATTAPAQPPAAPSN